MARNIAAALDTETKASVVHAIILVEMQFKSGTERVWNGLGTLNWDSKDWSGLGEYGSISGIKETADVSSTGIVLTLNGIPSARISTALTDDYQGRTVKVWFGGRTGTLHGYGGASTVIEPYQIFSGRMDVLTLRDSGETATATLTAESHLVDMERPRGRRYTDEDQQGEYPGDKFFDLMPSVQEKEIAWGSRIVTPWVPDPYEDEDPWNPG